jgi:8-oxo-dGTP diphosphatase
MYMQHIAQHPKVGVSCIIVSPEQPGAILVGKRKGSHGAGTWAPPGGHIELGEAWTTTCERELAEETGLQLSPARFHFITATNDTNIDGNITLHYITIFMTATLAAGEAAQIINAEPEKCEGWQWVQWSALCGLAESAPGDLFDPLLHFIESKKTPN